MVVHNNTLWVGGFKAEPEQTERRLRRYDNKLIIWRMLWHYGYGWAWTLIEVRNPKVLPEIKVN